MREIERGRVVYHVDLKTWLAHVHCIRYTLYTAHSGTVAGSGSNALRVEYKKLRSTYNMSEETNV